MIPEMLLLRVGQAVVARPASDMAVQGSVRDRGSMSQPDGPAINDNDTVINVVEVRQQHSLMVSRLMLRAILSS